MFQFIKDNKEFIPLVAAAIGLIAAIISRKKVVITIHKTASVPVSGENQAKLDQISGVKKDIAFGNQIRSYVLHPYQLVKDHRTKEQVGDINRVLDGDIDGFIKTYLMRKSSGTLGDAAPDDDD